MDSRITGAIIQARMGSTRLPGKVMMKIDTKNPVLYYVIKQLQECKFLKKIVIATTDLPEDNVIADYVHDMGIDCFRGSSNDVLDRYYECAKKFSFDPIVRITSDNPLIDPLIVDQVIDQFNNDSYDYISNCLTRTFPYGTEVEIFSFDALKKAWNNATKPSEREHVTSYFYNNPNRFKIFNIEYSRDISNLRWTVDRINDLKLVQHIVSKIKKRPILLTDILQLFSREPDLININKGNIANEGYLKSLEDEKNFF